MGLQNLVEATLLLYHPAHELNFIQGRQIDQQRINSFTCRERITF